MSYARSLFQRLGLFSRKEVLPDLFDLRLQRIGSREGRRDLRPGLFRS
jgi:hypothetical protein